jgi:hypothetical protein
VIRTDNDISCVCADPICTCGGCIIGAVGRCTGDGCADGCQDPCGCDTPTVQGRSTVHTHVIGWGSGVYGRPIHTHAHARQGHTHTVRCALIGALQSARSAWRDYRTNVHPSVRAMPYGRTRIRFMWYAFTDEYVILRHDPFTGPCHMRHTHNRAVG